MPTMPGVDIGGAFVRRAFSDNKTRLPVGMALTAAQVKSWKHWKQLEKVGYIVTWPISHATVSNEARAERFLLHEGFGKYSVVEGRKLNDRALTKDEAEKLAAI